MWSPYKLVVELAEALRRLSTRGRVIAVQELAAGSVLGRRESALRENIDLFTSRAISDSYLTVVWPQSSQITRSRPFAMTVTVD